MGGYGRSAAEFPNEKHIILGADLDDHVGKDRRNYARYMGNMVWESNEERRWIQNFSVAYYLTIANTFFQEEEKRVTFSSDFNRSQLDYFLIGSKELQNLRNCTEFQEEEGLISQHRSVVFLGV